MERSHEARVATAPQALAAGPVAPPGPGRRAALPALAAGLLCGHAGAEPVELPPVTGKPVPELAALDLLVASYMEDNGITGGVLGIMKDGVVVYLRGFGWKDEAQTILMPENALVRIASCTKPFTAAAIHRLVELYDVELDDFAFDLGQSEPGILHIAPFGGTPGAQLELVTLQHCLEHSGGWDSSVGGTFPFSDCVLAADLGIESPVSVDDRLSWLLAQDLAHTPGSQVVYAGEGYQVLGRIVEEVSGLDLLTFHHEHVLTREMWVPATDLLLGAGLAQPEPHREAWYGDLTERSCNYPLGGLDSCDPANQVPICYGGWHHEALVGSGGLVVSAPTALALADRYVVQNQSPDIGTPLDGPVDGHHGGTLNGTNTYLVQRSDGVNVFLFFNAHAGPGAHYAKDLYDADPGHDTIEELLDSLAVWPTTAVDGFWVDPEKLTGGYYGSYLQEYADLDEALAHVVDGSRLNLKAGVSNWTGTITTRLELRAPEGAVTIGLP